MFIPKIHSTLFYWQLSLQMCHNVNHMSAARTGYSLAYACAARLHAHPYSASCAMLPITSGMHGKLSSFLQQQHRQLSAQQIPQLSNNSLMLKVQCNHNNHQVNHEKQRLEQQQHNCSNNSTKNNHLTPLRLNNLKCFFKCNNSISS